jgi:hypothetical protein
MFWASWRRWVATDIHLDHIHPRIHIPLFIHGCRYVVDAGTLQDIHAMNLILGLYCKETGIEINFLKSCLLSYQIPKSLFPQVDTLLPIPCKSLD